jgi:hypothetical protein
LTKKEMWRWAVWGRSTERDEDHCMHQTLS